MENEKIFEIILGKWALITEMTTVLAIPFEATNVTQIATLTLSDFYFAWKKMESKLRKITNDHRCSTGFANTLLEKIVARQKYLLDTPAMITAIYLDPRFNFELKNNNNTIQIAKLTLADMYDRIMQLKENECTDSSMDICAEDDSYENLCVSMGLGRTFYGTANVNERIHSEEKLSRKELFDLLDAFAAENNRIHNKCSILSYWETRKDSDPILYEFASIIYAIPPSQATVERAFSALNHVFSYKRTNLLQETLECILNIKLNQDLAQEIFQEDEEQNIH